MWPAHLVEPEPLLPRAQAAAGSAGEVGGEDPRGPRLRRCAQGAARALPRPHRQWVGRALRSLPPEDPRRRALGPRSTALTARAISVRPTAGATGQRPNTGLEGYPGNGEAALLLVWKTLGRTSEVQSPSAVAYTLGECAPIRSCVRLRTLGSTAPSRTTPATSAIQAWRQLPALRGPPRPSPGGLSSAPARRSGSSLQAEPR